MYVAVLIPVVAVSLLIGDRAGLWRRATWALLGGLVPVAVLGFVDLIVRSESYFSSMEGQMKMMASGVAAAAVGTLVAGGLSRQPRVVRIFKAHQPRWALVAAGGVVAWFAAMWWVRPLVQTVTQDRPLSLVSSLQAAEGVAVDPSQLYDEQSMWWMAWYIGVAGLGLGILGAGVTARRLLMGRVRPAAFAAGAMMVVAGTAFWYRPSITPDHIWAMRRFVPSVMPSVAVMIAVAIGALVAADWGSATLRRGLAAGAVGLVLASTVVVTWPVRHQREQHGYVGMLTAACEGIGDDAAVLVIHGGEWATVPQPIRSWCQVPVAHAPPTIAAEELAALADGWEAAGRSLHLVSPDRGALSQTVGVNGDDVAVLSQVTNPWYAALTLTHPPDTYVGQAFALFGVPVGRWLTIPGAPSPPLGASSETHHPGSLFQRGRHPAPDAEGTAPRGRGIRPGGVAHRRRRLLRSDRRGGSTQRGRPRGDRARESGLANAFVVGLEGCLKAGADVIINTDADNQYSAESIPDLVAPILSGEADLVLGERPIETVEEFSWVKKRLQRLGSRVVRAFSGANITDAASGFRALTRDAAMRVQVFGHYTYTMETIVQAGWEGRRIVPVPIEVNPATRPSRLVRSIHATCGVRPPPSSAPSPSTSPSGSSWPWACCRSRSG